ncbi:MAG: type II secretion system F family protein [archaeon]|nr:type II secretion system F family protein [Candidatus Micrarchaeota archaeon]
MSRIDELRKVIERKKGKVGPKIESVDMEQVDKIVEKMKQKYSEEGIELEKVGGRLKELRGIIAEGKAAELEVQTVEDLKVAGSPVVRDLGKFYLSLGGIMKPIDAFIQRFPQVKQLNYYLYSANMKYSGRQFIAITTAATVITFIISILFFSIIFSVLKMNLIAKILLVIILSLVVALICIVICFLIPRRKAQARGDNISRELPFALRHMATELKAGIGLYRTIQTIAAADYGELSEEFARTITEIEEGTDTKLALRHFALRTQSKALRNALIHVIRALKTGGNLSEIMNDIAEEVSFELRMKIRDFSEKMNFFGVIYIYMAIVIPVFIAILGGVRIAPLQGGGSAFAMIPLDPVNLSAFYLLFMPIVLFYLIIFISMSQPKV